MQAEHPPGMTVHRGYSYPGLEKVYQGFGDNDDVLRERLREVKNCKVGLFGSLVAHAIN